jgi:aldehyde dehydrogenase (NAD+)
MNYQESVSKQRTFYQTEVTKSYAFRRDALIKLKEAIKLHETDILNALQMDLGKSHFEGYLTEVSVILLELNKAIKHLKGWMKVKRVATPLTLFKAKSYLYQEPYGTVLIMSPWNYPFQLTIGPLIGAIAAGNTAVIKSSPDSIHTSKLMKTMIEDLFPEEYVKIYTGGLDESKAVLSQRYDYIFFTGSTEVGKIVMSEASKYLTPITLELGGKSPAIIDDTMDLSMVAKRIVYGKFVNAGQTCIAPDYVMIQKGLEETFIVHANAWIRTFYGTDPMKSDDYPKIISTRHHARLVSLLQSGKPVVGGSFTDTKIEPTLLTHIDLDSPILKEEIFGPILPILTYESEDQMISELKIKEKPLALYLFTKNKQFEKKVLSQISFGGATLNDTIMHFANSNMPFGGVGHSGMGGYHGKFSFMTFSHAKGVVDRSHIIDLFFRYPPYPKKRIHLIKKIVK